MATGATFGLGCDIAVAIPAANEARFIGPALAALARSAAQAGRAVGAVVLANDCTDATASVARAAGARHGLTLRVVECRLPPHRRNAGHARRLAMAEAAAICAPGGLLVSTDADSLLMPGTLAAMAAECAAGADLVCGGISTRLPMRVARNPSIRRIDAATAAYAPLVHEIRFAIDRLHGLREAGPVPHYVESGACIALTAALHRRLGGLPDIASGEDRALVRAAEAAGARVVYSAAAHARVSARIHGRAPGGMAATILARMGDADPAADASLVPPDRLRREWRAALNRDAAARRPPPCTADPPLRASDLERLLPDLQGFVADAVRPAMAALDAKAGRRVA
ncbi:glycosyl transferase protein [Oceaniovalibus guishaninsula JLT2003]|uniref:Glycosyl transferase protein n=1 Tax=Oceaniovalibus guishaninsula JLT2003 TaxID=1231392 RepID=K2GJX9_9RHOB|nr:glycosyltransferase family 2 protein [Oceaniovalibus guishaninsula]EKE43076.1 glycosyl transferase protein [Oceaniovalibus guishaninsula JLT2003]